MAEPRDSSPQQEHETPDAKEDRQLIELLNELRVALPGVQMLFGFMLAVPFTQRFGSLSDRQRLVFYVAFLATAAASVCFITPASFHRIIFLGVAIGCVVGFLSSFLYSSVVAATASAAVLGSITVLWYSIPLLLRHRHRR